MARRGQPLRRAIARGLLPLAASLLAGCADASDPPPHVTPSDGAQAPLPPEEALDDAGERLGAFLDAMEVEKHWIAGHHVHWKTGDPDARPVPTTGSHSHCSAFVAAVCFRLGIPILEPPEHPQVLLATAQCAWLRDSGPAAGWATVDDGLAAQRLANRGALVVACYGSRDEDAPGHIAIVRPAALSAERIAEQGPQVIQAGLRNYNSTSLAEGFASHSRAVARGRIRFFAHALPGPGSETADSDAPAR